MKRTITKILMLAMLLFTTQAFALDPLETGIRYVKAGGTGDGKSWATASGNLQLMINDLALVAEPIAKEVRMAIGVYKPQIEVGGVGGRFATFILKDGINIVGGYAGTGPDADNLVLNGKSTLSGDLDDDGLLSNGDAYQVIIGKSLPTGVALKNLIITGGHANGSGYRTAPYNNVTIVNGAGITINDAVVNLINVDIKANASTNDGGAMHISSSTISSIVEITGGEISGNYFIDAGKSGGAIFVNTGSSLTADGTRFVDNRTNLTNGHGGAMYATSSDATKKTHITLKNSLFEGNRCAHYGGALHLNANLVVNIEGCTFKNNSNLLATTVTSGGGAISMFNSSAILSIKNSKFYSNRSQTRGGAIRSLAPINLLANSVFYDNSAGGEGGAIAVQGASKFVNNTFYKNTSLNTIAGLQTNAGAIWHAADVVSEVYNSLFIENTVGAAIKNFDKGTFNVYNSAFDGGGTGVDKGGIVTNISANLVFEKHTTADVDDSKFLNLKNNVSNLVVDRGLNSIVTEATDLAGNPRIVKSTATSPATVDLGAYEFQTTLPVNLISFTGKTKGSSSSLAWSTATESYNSKFILSRSADGIEFKFLANVSPKSANGAIYSYTDFSPLVGNNYYKLQQVDLNGKINELGLVVVKHNLNAVQISVYPNPVIGNDIYATFEKSRFSKVEVLDIYGKIVAKKAVEDNSSAIKVSVEGLSRGTYFMKFIGSKSILTEKFIKN